MLTEQLLFSKPLPSYFHQNPGSEMSLSPFKDMATAAMRWKQLSVARWMDKHDAGHPYPAYLWFSLEEWNADTRHNPDETARQYAKWNGSNGEGQIVQGSTVNVRNPPKWREFFWVSLSQADQGARSQTLWRIQFDGRFYRVWNAVRKIVSRREKVRQGLDYRTSNKIMCSPEG